MAVGNTKGDGQPADVTTQQDSSVDLSLEDELGSMVIEDDESSADVAEVSEDSASEDEESETEELEEDDESEEESDEDESEEEEESEGDDDDEEEPKHRKGERAERRIHKLTAQRNEAREKLAELEKRATELEAKSTSNIPLQPDYLSKSELEMIERSNDLIGRKQWLLEHVGVGFEDDVDESKSLTPKQVAQELARIERYSDDIRGAQQIYNERKKLQIEDMKAGRALREGKSKVADKVKTIKAAPKVKSTSPSAGTRKPEKSGVSRRGQNVDRFRKAGATEEAAERELAELTGLVD